MSTILVCIDGHAKSHLLVDYGFRKARENGASLTVLNIVSSSSQGQTIGQSAQIIKLLESASNRGANIVQVSAAAPEAAVSDYLKDQLEKASAISTVIAGSTPKARRFGVLRPDMATLLTRQFGGDLEITTVPLSSAKPDFFSPKFWITNSVSFRGMAYFFVLIALYSIVAMLLPVSDVPLPAYEFATATALLATIWLAYVFGVIPGLLFAVAAPLAVSYATNFTETSTFWLNSVLLSIVAIVVAYLSGDKQAVAAQVKKSDERLQSTYAILSNTINAADKVEMLMTLEGELSSVLKTDVAFLLATDGEDDLPQFNVFPQQQVFSSDEMRIAGECWRQDRATGFGTSIGLASAWRFELMSTSTAKLGVLAVKLPFGARLDLDFLGLISDLSDHIALQLAHIDLLSNVREQAVQSEREQLRSLLLSSISHDLKTPLASIIGALQMQRSLRERGKLSEKYASELESTAIAEAERLTSFIDNILSMTELESGHIKFDIHPVDPHEPVRTARRAVRAKYKDRTVDIETIGTPREILMDPLLAAQVLQNLLDNAAKYSPPTAPVEVSLRFDTDRFTYSVRDHGDGLADQDSTALFDKFERLNFTDTKVAGTGLGLAISKAIMEGHGGTIYAKNADGGGAQFDLVFPQ